MHVNHFIHLCLQHEESGQLLGYLDSTPWAKNNLRSIGAADEVVTRRASVGDRTSIAAVGVDDNTVRARRTCKKKKRSASLSISQSGRVTYHQCKHHSW